MTKETQKKTQNKLYFGFMFLQFTLVCVVFTSAYAIFQSVIIDPITLDKTGHAPFVAMFSIIPIMFLLSKSISTVSTEIKNGNLIFTNSFIIPIKSFSVKVSDLSSATEVKIKSQETPVIFENKKGTSAKVFYVYGATSIKINPKKESKSLKNTLIFGTQKSAEWLKILQENNVEIKKEQHSA